ncbi:hypothetical protein [Novipirellula rosea]|uniref:hypothetical protein n=1 Tax=Novipirellula rosea TaxID=1031540 RepID=UPI0031F0523C
MPNKPSDDIFEQAILRLDRAAEFASIESESLSLTILVQSESVRHGGWRPLAVRRSPR